MPFRENYPIERRVEVYIDSNTSPIALDIEGSDLRHRCPTGSRQTQL